MKADTWMPFYVATYLRATMHLTRDQHGAYLLLIMACWDRGGRLPNDPGQLAAIAKATPGEWRRLSPVMMPFFEIEDGFLVQGKVLEEHQKAARLSETRREAGAKGGRPKKETESHAKPKGFANAKQAETPALVALPLPLPVPSEPLSDANASSSPPADEKAERDQYPELFERAWKSYPHVKGRSSKKHAFAEWKRLGLFTQQLLPDACGKFGREGREPKMEGGAAAMERWLKGEKFADWIVPDAPTGGANLRPFPHPGVRQFVLDKRDGDDSWVRTWLDPCEWDDRTRTIRAPRQLTVDKLIREVPGLDRQVTVTIDPNANSRSAA